MPARSFSRLSSSSVWSETRAGPRCRTIQCLIVHDNELSKDAHFFIKVLSQLSSSEPCSDSACFPFR